MASPSSLRWQQIKTLLDRALDEPTGERADFLAAACPDDTELRREVVELLDHAPGATTGFLNGRALRRAEGESPHSNVGDRLGAYRLLREIGRGGMGVVWLARRDDGQFEKEVAIKLIKRGMDTDDILRRFRAERRILARLEHPHIARLLDAGTTEEGLPYLVMEYVAGEPFTRYLASRSFSEKLRLFCTICAAVQFAHQNFVLHRDLKPANILVTTDGTVKLLDFGVGKLLHPENATDSFSQEATATYTMPGTRAYTPGYAAPEQRRGDAVTTATDVYSLGAVLHELLTGKKPTFDNGSEEIRRPSAEWRSLRGDLDVILLKSLRSDPARRYPSVAALGEDIERHLGHLPIHARPEAVGYLAQKFLRRHWKSASGATLLLVVLLGGIISTRREAERAERNFTDVRHLANSFLFEFHDAIQDLAGSTRARRLVVERAVEYLDRLSEESASNPGLQLELATGHLKVGDVQGKPYTDNLGDPAGALRSYGKTIDICETLLASRQPFNLVTVQDLLATALENAGQIHARLHHKGAAVLLHRRSHAIRQQLLAAAPENPRWRGAVAAAQLFIGDDIMAENHLNPTLARYRSALAAYRIALPIYEKLALEKPDGTEHQRNLTRTLDRVAMMQEILGPATHDSAMIEETMALFRRKQALDEASLAAAPDSRDAKRDLSGTLLTFAEAQTLASLDLDLAKSSAQRALSLAEELAAVDSANRETLQDLNIAHFITGEVLKARGELPQAAEHFRASIALLEKLFVGTQENIEAESDRINSWHQLGETLRAQGDEPGAREAFRRSVDYCEKMAAAVPEDGDVRERLAAERRSLGEN